MVLPVTVLCALLAAGNAGDTAAPRPADAPDATTAAAPRIRWVATIGYDFPVGESVTLRLADAGAPTSEVRLNGGFVAQVGAGYAPSAQLPLELRATVGVKDYAAVSAGAHLTYRAFPVELLGAWRVGSVAFAAGASVALGGSVSGEDVVSAVAADLKTSVGLVGQVEWAQRPSGSRLGTAFGARVLWQTLQGEGGGTLGASAVGLFVGLSY